MPSRSVCIQRGQHGTLRTRECPVRCHWSSQYEEVKLSPQAAHPMKAHSTHIQLTGMHPRASGQIRRTEKDPHYLQWRLLSTRHILIFSDTLALRVRPGGKDCSSTRRLCGGDGAAPTKSLDALLPSQSAPHRACEPRGSTADTGSDGASLNITRIEEGNNVSKIAILKKSRFFLVFFLFCFLIPGPSHAESEPGVHLGRMFTPLQSITLIPLSTLCS